MFKKLAVLTIILGTPFYTAQAMEAPIAAKPIKEIPNSHIEVEIINRTPKNITIGTDNPYPWYSSPGGNVTNTTIGAGQTGTVVIKPIFESSLYVDPTSQATSSLRNFISINSEDYAPNPYTGFVNGLDFRIDNDSNGIRSTLIKPGAMGWLVQQQQLATISAPPYSLKARLILEGENAQNSSIKLLTTQPTSLKDIALRSIAKKINEEGVKVSKTLEEAYNRLPVETRDELAEKIGRVGDETAAAAEKDTVYW